MSDTTAPEIDGALPRGFVRACILLLLSEEPGHGYDLLARLEAFGLGDSDPAGMYRTLRGMERDGLVVSHWETSEAGPSRRTYEISDLGAEDLRAWGDALSQCRAIVDRYLATHDRLRKGTASRPRAGTRRAPQG